jgi:hypothetical protein
MKVLANFIKNSEKMEALTSRERERERENVFFKPERGKVIE